MNARLSIGPQSQVSATPTSELPTSGLMRQSRAPVPPIASTMKLVGGPRKRSTSLAGGRSTAGAKTSGGGSSIIAGPRRISSRLREADRIRPRSLLWKSRQNARSTRFGNRAGRRLHRPTSISADGRYRRRDQNATSSPWPGSFPPIRCRPDRRWRSRTERKIERNSRACRASADFEHKTLAKCEKV